MTCLIVRVGCGFGSGFGQECPFSGSNEGAASEMPMMENTGRNPLKKVNLSMTIAGNLKRLGINGGELPQKRLTPV